MSRTTKSGDVDEEFTAIVGAGGETNQHLPRQGSHCPDAHLTTDQGIRVSEALLTDAAAIQFVMDASVT